MLFQELEINALVFSLKGIMFGSNCAVASVAIIAPTAANIATHPVKILNRVILFLALLQWVSERVCERARGPLARPATN